MKVPDCEIDRLIDFCKCYYHEHDVIWDMNDHHFYKLNIDDTIFKPHFTSNGNFTGLFSSEGCGYLVRYYYDDNVLKFAKKEWSAQYTNSGLDLMKNEFKFNFNFEQDYNYLEQLLKTKNII